jgi:hypothetical protein
MTTLSSKLPFEYHRKEEPLLLDEAGGAPATVLQTFGRKNNRVTNDFTDEAYSKAGGLLIHLKPDY